MIKGTFEVVDGKLNFVCTTNGVSYEEVQEAITKLRDECQRQLDNGIQCPFHPLNKHKHEKETLQTNEHA